MIVVIRSFKHKGLERFFFQGTRSGIQTKHAVKLRLVLGRLGAAVGPKDMDLPGLNLHSLSGKRTGIWSVSVSGNWRVTFRFKGGHAELVNYEDYH
jgi:proteic killer suppression protein